MGRGKRSAGAGCSELGSQQAGGGQREGTSPSPGCAHAAGLGQSEVKQWETSRQGWEEVSEGCCRALICLLHLFSHLFIYFTVISPDGTTNVPRQQFVYVPHQLRYLGKTAAPLI